MNSQICECVIFIAQSRGVGRLNPLFVLSLCPFDISVGVGAFVIGLSQIFSFLSVNQVYHI